MGVQQNKKSKARTRNRRTQWAKMDAPKANACPNCQEPKMPHRLCTSCGYYKGTEVVAAE